MSLGAMDNSFYIHHEVSLWIQWISICFNVYFKNGSCSNIFLNCDVSKPISRLDTYVIQIYNLINLFEILNKCKSVDNIHNFYVLCNV